MKLSVLSVQCPSMNDKIFCEKNSPRNGENTINDTTCYTYFDPDLFCSLNVISCDIFLLISRPNEKNKSNLLLARYMKSSLPLSSNRKAKKMFQSVQSFSIEKKHNNGIERNRYGGALGTVTYSREMFDLFHTKNSSPRKSRGVFWLPDYQKDNSCTALTLSYRGTKDGTIKTFKYANPKYGGQFTMKWKMFKEFPFLLEFCMFKPLVSTVIRSLNLETVISPEAISNESEKLTVIETDVLNIGRNLKPEFMSSLHVYCAMYMKYDRYTLVCHPVGRHIDNFGKGVSSKLENRFCMSFELDRFNRTNIGKVGSLPYGRGGAGLHSYAFAVLDW